MPYATTLVRAAGALSLGMAASVGAAAAETDLQSALSDGARALTSEEIAERLVGKTVTFESDGNTFLVFYGPDNAVSGAMPDGDWSDTGLYGVTTDDRICLSWDGSDQGRLRCMSVLAVDGVLRKYHADGSVFGDITDAAEGKTF